MNGKCTIGGCTMIVLALLIFLLCVSGHDAHGESYTMKAPDVMHSVKLPQNKYFEDTPFAGFSLKVEGWACDERFAEMAVYRIKEINRMTQPLLTAVDALAQVERTLGQMGREKMNEAGRKRIKDTVEGIVADSVKRAGFTSEQLFTKKIESLSREVIKSSKGGINSFFGFPSKQNVFINETSGVPSGIWKLSKMEPDDPPTVVFIAQNCYRKNDLETMINSVVSAATKLDGALKNFRDMKKKVLNSAGIK